MPRLLQSLSLVLLVLGCSTAFADSLTERRLAAQQEKELKLREDYQQTLQKLMRDCAERGRTDAVQEVLAAIRIDAASDLSALTLPGGTQKPIADGVVGFEREWRTRLQTARKSYAKDLFILSRNAIGMQLPGYAFQLVHRVAALDSDHEQARKILGYVERDGKWVTQFEAKMLQQRYAWDDEFGWILETHLPRYRAGERFYNNRWMPAEREAIIRSDFNNAWEIRTEHFLVKTNVSHEIGVEIASELEIYYRFFVQVFSGFFSSNAEIQRLFSSGTSGTRGVARKPYVVHYYASKDEYVARLKSKIAQIAITNGLYWTEDRIAHFFHDPKRATWATLYHEATHQFFYECLPIQRTIAMDSHFWIVEGIACYMESFTHDENGMSVGDPEYIRFAAARHRLLRDRYFVPFSQMDARGMREFQSSMNLRQDYSQASGMAHFFMHYESGRYRIALVEHLSQMYRRSPRNRRPVPTLPKLTGQAASVLDRQYLQYMRDQEARLQQGR